MKERMHIDRKPSTVLIVIERIYYPIAQTLGVSLLLRNEINTEIQFPPKFFINLIQITGNLVANAIKFTSPNGFVVVVLNINAEADQNMLNLTVTDTGYTISHDLVLAFNKSEQAGKLMGADVDHSFGTRLKYVLELVSEEGGRIFLKSEKNSGTTFSLSLPLQKNDVKQMNGFQPIVKNGAVIVNGSLN